MFRKSVNVFQAHLATPTVASYEKLFWCLSKRNHFDESFYNAIAEKVLSGGFRYSSNPHFLCSFVNSCASVKYYHAALMDYASKTLLPLLDKLPLASKLTLVHSFSFINHIDKDLLLEVAREVIVEKHPEIVWSANELIWPCLVADIYPQDIFEHVFARLYFGM